MKDRGCGGDGDLKNGVSENSTLFFFTPSFSASWRTFCRLLSDLTEADPEVPEDPMSDFSLDASDPVDTEASM